jgi:hypothetical protein
MDDRQARLVEGLLKQTQGLIGTAVCQNGTYIAFLTDKSVRIRAVADGEDAFNYDLDLVNGGGEVVDTFTFETICPPYENPPTVECSYMFGYWHDKLGELHDAAKRSTLRPDDLLNDGLLEIENGG